MSVFSKILTPEDCVKSDKDTFLSFFQFVASDVLMIIASSNVVNSGNLIDLKIDFLQLIHNLSKVCKLNLGQVAGMMEFIISTLTLKVG